MQPARGRPGPALLALMVTSGFLLASLAAVVVGAPTVSAADAGTGPAEAGALAGEGLAAPPAWAPGDWWRVRLTNRWLPEPVEGRIVVAAEERGAHLLGMPDGRFRIEHLFHSAVPLGRVTGAVAREDAGPGLGEGFEPLRFPLRPGASWRTTYEGDALTVTVERIDGNEATLTYTPEGDGPSMRARYDATLGMFRDFERGELWRWEVVDHGHGYACTVDVPVGITRLFSDLDGTTGSPGPGNQRSSLRHVVVDQAFDVTALYMFVFGREAGVFQETATSPDGQVYRATAEPGSGGLAHTLRFFWGRPGPGVWTLERTVVGVGVAWAEGVGYDTMRFSDGQPREDDAGNCAAEAPPAPPRMGGPGAPAPAGDRAHAAGAGPAPPLLDALQRAWVAATVAGALGLAGAMLLRRMAAQGLALPVPLPLLALYHRLRGEDLLAHPQRATLFMALLEGPGRTAQELSTALGASRGTVVHHLRILARHGVVVSVAWGREQDWYLASRHPPADRLAWSALRRPGTRQVYEAITAHPGVSQHDLATTLGVHHGAVIFHVARLERAGLVATVRENRSVRYAATTKAPPTLGRIEATTAQAAKAASLTGEPGASRAGAGFGQVPRPTAAEASVHASRVGPNL